MKYKESRHRHQHKKKHSSREEREVLRGVKSAKDGKWPTGHASPENNRKADDAENKVKAVADERWMTAAEAQAEQVRSQRAMQRILAGEEKSHKRRIAEYSAALQALPEHFDRLKVNLLFPVPNKKL